VTKIEEWAAIQAKLFINSHTSNNASVLVEVLKQAYESGLRDGELQTLKEARSPFGPFMMPPPAPVAESGKPPPRRKKST
jgi:hypothetical protein